MTTTRGEQEKGDDGDLSHDGSSRGAVVHRQGGWKPGSRDEQSEPDVRRRPALVTGPRVAATMSG